MILFFVNLIGIEQNIRQKTLSLMQLNLQWRELLSHLINYTPIIRTALNINLNRAIVSHEKASIFWGTSLFKRYSQRGRDPLTPAFVQSIGFIPVMHES